MRFRDRQPLKAGYYWEPFTGRIMHIPHPLMGDRRKHYIRVPALLLVLAGPLLGLLYILWLPLVILAILAVLIVRRLVHAFRVRGRDLFLAIAARRQNGKNT